MEKPINITLRGTLDELEEYVKIHEEDGYFEIRRNKVDGDIFEVTMLLRAIQVTPEMRNAIDKARLDSYELRVKAPLATAKLKCDKQILLENLKTAEEKEEFELAELIRKAIDLNFSV